MVGKQAAEASPMLTEAPAATSTNPAAQDDTGGPPKKARRTFLTQNACNRCRQKKSKCDGKRPVCGRCEKHGADCEYQVAQEGVTRMQNLQNQLNSKTGEHDKLMQLFEAMQGGSDQRATTLLAKLRMGDTIDNLLSYVGEGHASSSSSQQPGLSPANSPSGSGYLSQWSLNTPSQGYWNTRSQSEASDWNTNSEVSNWTTPSEQSSRTQSQSSVPHLGARRMESGSLPIRDAHQSHEAQEASYYQMGSPQDMPQQRQSEDYSYMQWQRQEDAGTATPYYDDALGRQLKRGKHSREQGE